MNVLENYTGYKIDDVLAVTSRINNKRRNYLLLNKLQAKYIPTNAITTLDMFEKLAERVQNLNGKVIVVGFAETATAIGARVAYSLCKRKETLGIEQVISLTTTREKRDVVPICEFKEEHSHAVEQILYGNKKDFETADWIIFAEDEVTTGNTIHNCVKQLSQKYTCKYAVASILNCMSEDEMNMFKENNIDAYYLIKTDKDGLDKQEPSLASIHIKSHISDIRLGVNPILYETQLERLAETIEVYIRNFRECCGANSVLVLGTEECMYPAIKVSERLTIKGFHSDVSATTRVPTSIEGPLVLKEKVESLYGDRETYIYNLTHYDVAVIVTDGDKPTTEITQLLSSKYGINNIISVQI